MSSPPLLAQAQRLLDDGRWRDARPLLESLLAARPQDRMLLFALCEAEIHDGAASNALARLSPLKAADFEAAFLNARAQAAMGRHAEARDELQAVRDRLPQGSANVEWHLAAAHAALGEMDEALAALDRTAALAGRDASAWLRVAQAAADLARPEVLARALAQARASAPPDAASWRRIGQLSAEMFDWAGAAQALAEAARRDPADVATATLAAMALGELGETEAAHASLARVGARESESLELAVAKRLLLPQVYDDRLDVAQWREHFTRGLAELLGDEARWRPLAHQVFSLNRTNFLLAYQGGDDLPLQRDYSRFIAGLTRVAEPALHEPLARRFDGGRRLRVGFVSSFFRDCTVGRYFERWITALDASRFERFLYLNGALQDEFTARLASHCDRFTLLRGGSLDAARRIKADALDVLVYPEIGMDAAGYILATLRLAPVQLAAWGHPVTTGSTAIDGFLTVGAMEPPEAGRHYVEPLLPLPGVGVDYAMPSTPRSLDRGALGLPANAHVYACPQSLFKIHPDMDEILARIVAEDPQAVLVFFQGIGGGVTRRFGERLQRAMAARDVPPRSQVKFMPRMAAADFRALLATCDVALDTLHWSGGNTSFDAFAAGLPVVTLPGAFMRGRQTAAMLQLMGLPELVARDPESVATIAMQLAADRDANRALRERIAQGREAIFERPEPVEALARYLLERA